MKWGISQIAGISAIAKRFLGIEDKDLLILLERLKQLEDSYTFVIYNCIYRVGVLKSAALMCLSILLVLRKVSQLFHKIFIKLKMSLTKVRKLIAFQLMWNTLKTSI